jgi:putative spermidine/putrescine transport system substrate-binding protein
MALAAAGCSAGSLSADERGIDWRTVTSAAAGGGMAKLAAAARAEGGLNVIALPPTWANYGTIIKDFTAKYGIKVHSADPQASSEAEVSAVRRQHGGARAPDVLDIGMPVALASPHLFAPYRVSTWSDIPATQKDTNGLWVQDYGGYMSVGYDSARFGRITSVSQLLTPAFRAAVALNGDPAQATAALDAVMLASLAEGGTTGDIAPGVGFFHRLAQVGNFVPAHATNATVRAGTTPVVINWDYLNTAAAVGSPRWRVFIPPSAVLGGYYAQAISKTAPHPAAARLWEEFLYSQARDGGQNLWLLGGARPVELAAMTAAGTVNATAAARLPPVRGTPQFLSPAQATRAASYVQAHWAQAVKLGT